MGRTLSLLGHVVTRARHLIAMHQYGDALTALTRVGSSAPIAATAAADVQHLLGEARFKLGDLRRARRHLRESLRLEPANPAAWHLLARATESDPLADASRASRAYRTALQLAPRDPRLLADAGAYFVQMDRVKKGLALLRQAAELAPDDLGILRTRAETYCELERFDEALSVVKTAAFRWRNEPRLAQLREQIEFRQARLEQRRAGGESIVAGAEPVVLPFLGIVGERPVRTGTTYRRDVISKIRPHLPRLMPRQDSGRSG